LIAKLINSSFPSANLGKKPVLIVWIMPLCEQKDETIDELLKPFKKGYFTECGIFLYGKSS
jgi:hypothetical protein